MIRERCATLVLGASLLLAGLWAGAAVAGDFASWSVLPEEDLADERGGQSIVIAGDRNNTGIAEVVATINNNVIGDVGATGLISANSVMDVHRVTTVMMNTGNQVNMSNATVVNVYLD